MHRSIRFILHRLRPVHPPCLMAVAILYAVIAGLALWCNAGPETQGKAGDLPADSTSEH